MLLAAAGPASGPAARADTATELKEIRWIDYAPTGYYPGESPPVLPDKARMAADLGVLREAGFTGLVTYGADLEDIPVVAETAGFKAMLLGIWDPFDPVERDKALRAVAAHRKLIKGIIVGNEGLTSGRYALERLCSEMRAIRQAANRPVTTTEPVDFLLAEPGIGGCSDFITVNAHPYFSNRKTPESAVQWTQDSWDTVRRAFPGKPVLFKEVGLPTAGDAAMSEDTQTEYYTLLAKTGVVFCYFEAFDASPRFKPGAIEQSWGLWRSDRTPKRVVAALPWKPER
jgi:exo-beta-1,3-glucanase (GH17 family)